MKAIIVGASSGIGAALARRLIDAGWTVVGIARRALDATDLARLGERYRHAIGDVRAAEPFRALLASLCDEPIDLCVYCAGIGELLELPSLAHDVDVLATNLVGCAAAAEVIVPHMIAARRGHFIGLSSQADRVIDRHAPSYAASKAGLSSYLEGLALACAPHGVAITSIRFGFVDTPMAKSDIKPFMITADRAAEVIVRCLKSRPIRRTYPLRMAMLLWIVRLGPRLRVWLS